jgi:Tfp pilus assembly protein PilZ
MKTIKLRIDDEKALYKAHIPLIEQGGLFVACSGNYCMGERVRLCADILNASYRFETSIVWITPEAVLGRDCKPGIGVAIPSDQSRLRDVIDTALGGFAKSPLPRDTF